MRSRTRLEDYTEDEILGFLKTKKVSCCLSRKTRKIIPFHYSQNDKEGRQEDLMYRNWFHNEGPNEIWKIHIDGTETIHFKKN